MPTIKTIAVCRVCKGTLTFGRLSTDCHEFSHRGTVKGAAALNSAVLPRRRSDGTFAAWCMLDDACTERGAINIAPTMYEHGVFARHHVTTVHGWDID